MAHESEHYALAKQHVIDAEARVARQREIIRDLGSAGSDTRLAQELLFLMQQTLSLARVHLQMIEVELAREDDRQASGEPTGRGRAHP